MSKTVRNICILTICIYTVLFFNQEESESVPKKMNTSTISYQKTISPTVPKNPMTVKTEVPSNQDISEESPLFLNLSLELVEVIPPPQREAINIYGGELQVSGNSIDYLILNMDEHFEISFASLNGNTFEYHINGETYSEMLYQVDQDSYMLTLTNGLLEAYRFRFISKQDERNIAHEEYDSNYDLNNYRGFYE